MFCFYTIEDVHLFLMRQSRFHVHSLDMYNVTSYRKKKFHAYYEKQVSFLFCLKIIGNDR